MAGRGAGTVRVCVFWTGGVATSTHETGQWGSKGGRSDRPTSVVKCCETGMWVPNMLAEIQRNVGWDALRLKVKCHGQYELS